MGIFMGRTKSLEADIDSFFDNISQAALIFKSGIRDYLSSHEESFQKKIEEITSREHEADKLRRDVKYRLYSQMLVPESRGDLLGLLENSDNVIDDMKSVLSEFDIQRPDIPDFIKTDFFELTDHAVSAVDEMVKASRSFLKEIKLVNDFINKVFFYEHEADQVEERLKRQVFGSGEVKELCQKIHLRYFIERISNLADDSEEVCERLSVSVIKRFV